MDSNIKELLDSNILQQLINEYTLMVVQTGSRIIDICDDKSDYDLIFIVKKEMPKELINNNQYININGIQCHWYYRTIEDLLPKQDERFFKKFLSYLYIGSLTKENILYDRNNFANQFITYCTQAKNVMFDYCGYNLFKRVNNNDLKLQYYKLLCYDLAKGNILDKDYLNSIKRRTISITDTRYINHLDQATKYFNSVNTYMLEIIIDNLRANLNNLFN